MNGAYQVTLIGIGINFFLAALKIAAGWWGHSQAVFADGIHSLSDLATDFLTLFGIRYGSAPPDACHPYGHRRIETLIAVIIGVILGAGALALTGKALYSLVTCSQGKLLPAWVLLPPTLSLFLKEALYRVTLKVGQRLGSPAVIANALHHRSDALSSIPAIAGPALAAWRPDLTFFDPLASVAVSFFILKAAWEIIHPGVVELCDGVSVGETETIRKEVLGVPGVKGTHRIRTRKHAGHTLVDLHIQVDPELSVREGHAISERVKRTLLHHHPRIIDVVVHLEPFEEINPEASSSPDRPEGADEGETRSDRPANRN
ncbi:cation diffusion facilitator family transporter [Thermosulfurimonas sp.]|uniref:cation diffusion facilitator family transporter n=1 Tax=Thermosulfurimonas sp. TaxID=2080236 RepID=UPI0025E90BA9|nr:cation diffusion facilitator family transporter [Thermosulfurimonas sp.]